MILAPMAGVTDAAFRHICIDYGCKRAFCEMVSANALKYNSKKTMALLDKADNEKKLNIQLFGGDSNIMCEAALKLKNAFEIDIIDINMGCPMPKITKSGYGAALLLNPQKAGEIVYALKKRCGGTIGVKMRIGFNGGDVDYVAFAKAMEDSGADLLTVHGRTAKQLYSGRADINAIKKVRESVNICVIGNGDVFSVADAENMLKQTGCDDVLVARGAMGNPFIFEGRDEVPFKERLDTAVKHLELCVHYKSEALAVLQMRKHIAWYIKGARGSSEMRAKINTCKSAKEIKDLLMEYADKNE